MMTTRRWLIALGTLFVAVFLLALLYFRYQEPRPVTPPYVPAPKPVSTASPSPKTPVSTPSPSPSGPVLKTAAKKVDSVKREVEPPPELPNPVRPGVFPRLYANDVLALPHGVWRVPLGFSVDVQQRVPITSAVQGHCSKPQKDLGHLSPETLISMGFSQVGADWFFLGAPCHVDVIEAAGTIERLWVNQCLKRDFTTKKFKVDDPSCDGQRLLDLQAAQ